MNANGILELNVRKVIRCLGSIISADELAKIEAEFQKQIAQLMRLSQSHLRFAKNLTGSQSWRQRVSRGYYCAYSASKAIRLDATGVYNQASSDHKKIGDLPENFDAASRWKDILTKYRADRNIADYDHSASEKDLELSSAEYLEEAEKFIKEARRYLKSRGVLK